MTSLAQWPSNDEIVELEVDVLGMHILRRLVEEGQRRKSQNRQSFIEARTMQVHQSRRSPERGMTATYSWEAMRAEPDVARALAEAWEWLVGEELIALDAVALAVSEQAGPDPYFVTRWGAEVAAEGAKALALTLARRRLGLELHPALRRPLGRLVRVGAFEEAAFVALREVEQRVGTLAGHPSGRNGRLRGDKLMTAAFNEGGRFPTRRPNRPNSRGR
jgi:hypothetical protein